MTLAPVDAQSRQAFGIAATTKGLVVQGVKTFVGRWRQGRASRRRDRPHGDREVTSVADLAAALAEWKKEGRTSIPLEIDRNGVYALRAD